MHYIEAVNNPDVFAHRALQITDTQMAQLHEGEQASVDRVVVVEATGSFVEPCNTSDVKRRGTRNTNELTKQLHGVIVAVALASVS